MTMPQPAPQEQEGPRVPMASLSEVHKQQRNLQADLAAMWEAAYTHLKQLTDEQLNEMVRRVAQLELDNAELEEKLGTAVNMAGGGEDDDASAGTRTTD